MFQLVYTSTAARAMKPRELESLLETARAKNDRLGITGMLLYRDERFLQALEGEQKAVRRLYEAIRADERHTTVITLRERLMDAREFPDWTMGFADLERADDDEHPAGYTPFMNGDFTPDHFRQHPGQVHETLMQFREVAQQ